MHILLLSFTRFEMTCIVIVKIYWDSKYPKCGVAENACALVVRTLYATMLFVLFRIWNYL